MLSIDSTIVEKKTLNERVYLAILNAIIDGNVKPESKLKEEHVAKQLGVSATPVREAFKKLAGDGFIEIIPYHGAIVRGIDAKEVADVYKCREALEHMALEESMDNFDEKTLKKLYVLIEKEKENVGVMQVSQTNSTFHEIIYKMADNKMLERLIDMLNKVVARDMKFSASDATRREEIQKEHEAIVNAIKDKNLKAAKKAMSKHIKNGQKYIEKKRCAVMLGRI